MDNFLFNCLTHDSLIEMLKLTRDGLLTISRTYHDPAVRLEAMDMAKQHDARIKEMEEAGHGKN